MQQTSLKDYRCLCGKLLFKGSFAEGTVEVKCKNCRKVLSFLGEGPSESSDSSGGREISPE